MESPKSVFIIDDHPLFREGLKTILRRSDKFRIVGEAGDGRTGLKEVLRIKPEILILDISLPDISGLKVAREIKLQEPNCMILILSMHSKIDYIEEAFQAGATGYLVKETASDRLLDSMEIVARGDVYMDGTVSTEIIQKLVQNKKQQEDISDPTYHLLTSREQEVLRYLAEGLSAKETARQLQISHKTVENHRASIMKKLDLHNKVELVRYAVRLGLIDLDLWKS